MRAFRQLGGSGPVWIRTRIPIGRGLGFSGSARVAGLVAALAQRHGSGFHPLDEAEQLLHVATALEGHADNIAPSIFGGVVASAGGHAVRIPLPFDPAVVVWVPSATTSTDQSRAALCPSVPFADAVFNVGRTALLVAALAAGDIHALRTATEDRLHQDQRFALSPMSRQALTAALDAGAWCGWLSGSGAHGCHHVRSCAGRGPGRDVARRTAGRGPHEGPRHRSVRGGDRALTRSPATVMPPSCAVPGPFGQA